MINSCIFDLDGVIVDTAKYHFLAWKRLADEFDINFTEDDNELLKGVSRIESLNIILKIGNKQLDDAAFEEALVKKNGWYLEYINKIDESEILPGVQTFLADIRAQGIKTALDSASKNSVLILERIGLLDKFDAIVDGNKVSNAKPDPEVFVNAAKELDSTPDECLVFEDAAAGVQAAVNAKMKVVGIGSAEVLGQANYVMPGFEGATLEALASKVA